MKKESILNISGKTILCAMLFWSAFGGHAEASASSTPALRGDPIKEIESDLNREKKKFEEFDAHERDLLAEISELEKEVATQKRVLGELKKRIRETKTSKKDLEEKLSQAQELTRQAETRVAKRLVALYKHARRGYFRILANAQDLDQFGQRLVYLRSIMEEDRKVIVRMDEEQRRQRREIAQIQKALREKENTQKEEKARFSSLTKDLEVKAVHLMKVHKEKEFYETAVRELEIEAKNLSQELVRIEKDAYEIPQALRFEDSKGHLILPLEGEIVKWGGGSGSAKGGLHKGVFIEGFSNRKVKAVFPGRVDYSGSLKGYGEVIIINHGSRFFTISAYLSKRQKEQGDMAKAGEVIGSAGQIGSSQRSRFYFEIRKGEQNLDPLKWLKLADQ